MVFPVPIRKIRWMLRDFEKSVKKQHVPRYRRVFLAFRKGSQVIAAFCDPRPRLMSAVRA